MLLEHICPKNQQPVKSEIIGNGIMKKEIWKDKSNPFTKEVKIWKTIIVRCSYCGEEHEYALTMNP